MPSPTASPTTVPDDLQPGGIAEVAVINMYVRDSPSSSQNSSLLVLRGSTLTILEAPIVAEGLEWYYVEFSGGMRGYIGNEAAAGWLEPVSPVTSVQTTFRCESGNLPSILEIGQQGFPSFGWDDSTLRTLPGGRAIRDIPEGEHFTVIDGPHCTSNGTMWFRVEHEDAEGWISQGNDENGYWITPLTAEGVPDPSR